MAPDYYAVLGVDRDATAEQIKKTYRKLARKYHPDINPGDQEAEARFKEISEAYKVLSTPDLKAKYDRHGSTSDFYEEAARAGFDFSGFDFTSFGRDTFGDIFSQLFEGGGRGRGAARPPGPQPGGHLTLPIAIDFMEAIRGCTRRLAFPRQAPCAACAGAGLQDHTPQACPDCGGQGQTSHKRGFMQFHSTCGRCGGAGQLPGTPCGTCGGSGLTSREETVSVKLPPGVQSQSRIRLAGKGHHGPQGGPPGDAYVVPAVGTHRFFERIGDNIHCTVPITITEAALGAKVQVPTVDGPATMRVPPGTQSEQVFRLREKGSPSLRGGRGDQYVKVRIIPPSHRDERTRDLLRELAQANPEDPRAKLLADYAV